LSKALRVLFVSDVASPRVNGVSTSIATFRADLEALGVEVQLVAPRYDDGRGTLREGHDWRVPGRRVPLDPEDRLMRPGPLRLAVQSAAVGVDVLHVQTPFRAHGVAVAVARQQRIPLVETHHTDFEAYGEHYLPWAPRTLLRRLGRAFVRSRLAAVDAVVVPSTAIAVQLRGYGLTGTIAKIPTGLPTVTGRAPDREGFREALGIAPDQPTMVHVGRVAHEKNIGFLLEMHARVLAHEPRTVFIIAGEGPAREDLKRKAEQLGTTPAVRFVGYLDRLTTLRDCYSAGDLFTFASRTETQGLVLLEAMALGVPVVSTAVGGTQDVVGPERGAVAVPEELDTFVATCLALLRDPARRQHLGQSGRQFVADEWSSRACALKLIELYRALGSR
jgi:1,2-diacylglycerol 3-alpha-glucosyltransferase